MCGIVGVAGKVTVKDEDVFKLLLILDAVRGIDSTGMAAIHANGEVSVVKQVGTTYDLMDDRRFTPALRRINRAIIGHNRWATQGAVNRRNAHPFDFDSLVGVHNGSLTTKYLLDDAKDFTVDSENLFHHIDKKGLDDALKHTGGAWSLVWWDKYEDTLNFLRNKERPMHYCYNKAQDVVYWASEAWMLEVALSRIGVERTEVQSTEVDKHYCVEIDKAGKMTQRASVMRPSTYIPYVAPKTNHQHGHKWNPAIVPASNEVVKQITQQTLGNVVVVGEEEKKSSPINIKKGYVNSKGNTYQLISSDVDTHGATYIHCWDATAPYVNVRLYVKPDDELLGRMDEFYRGDVKDVKVHEKEGTYYKLARETMKSISMQESETMRETVEGILKKDQEDAADDVPFDPVFKNHRGVVIDEDMWYASYGCCQVCSGVVDPHYKFKFTLSSEAVCHECVEDKEVSQYINFA